jgi:hypothetical protein
MYIFRADPCYHSPPLTLEGRRRVMECPTPRSNSGESNEGVITIVIDHIPAFQPFEAARIIHFEHNVLQWLAKPNKLAQLHAPQPSRYMNGCVPRMFRNPSVSQPPAYLPLNFPIRQWPMRRQAAAALLIVRQCCEKLRLTGYDDLADADLAVTFRCRIARRSRENTNLLKSCELSTVRLSYFRNCQFPCADASCATLVC